MNDKAKFVFPVWLTPALIKLVIEIVVAVATAIPAMIPIVKEFLEALKGNLPEIDKDEAIARIDAAMDSLPDWQD